MKINRLSPDIYQIEDFVTEPEQKKVLDFCALLEEYQWWIALSEQDKDQFFYGKQLNLEKPKVFEDINKRIKSLYTRFKYVNDAALQRYRISDAMQHHRDYWRYEEDFHIRYGIVIYYNDNYSGGEIEYPDLGIVHKPKARSLLMHGGNILHGTLPVTSDDVRYFSTAFVRGSKDEPVVLNKDLFSQVELHDGSIYK